MSWGPLGRTFVESIDTGLNANTSSVTTSLDILGCTVIFIEVVANTGAHSNHIVTVQCSADNSVWHDSVTTIAQLGIANNKAIISRYVRAKVTTPEGGASTIDITIQAK